MTSHATLAVVAGTCAVLLAACAGSDSGGGFSPGLYVADGDTFVRLDGPAEWERTTWDERSDLSPEPILVAYDPALAGGSIAPDTLVLQRVAFHRNDIDARSGDESLPTGGRWIATDIRDLQVPLEVTADPGRPGMVRATPAFPLEPGLYALRMNTPGRTTNARFGVDWESVDQVVYQTRYCVDRYVDGQRIAYDLCTPVPADASAVLTIGELKPVKRVVGTTEMLVVDGTVANPSDRPRRVPPLRASVGGSGNDSWTFDAESAYLLPGDSTTFHTELKNPPGSATNVHVEFASN